MIKPEHHLAKLYIRQQATPSVNRSENTKTGLTQKILSFNYSYRKEIKHTIGSYRAETLEQRPLHTKRHADTCKNTAGS